jgi:hypothetical protein
MVEHNINKFLESQHPHEAHQFIIGLSADWMEIEYQKHHGDFDKWDAISGFLEALRISLDARLQSQSSQVHSRKIRKIKSVPWATRMNKRRKIVSLMERMSTEEAISFVVKVTTEWCFSIPENFIPLMDVHPHDHSDKAIADAVYEWFVRYFDMWH